MNLEHFGNPYLRSSDNSSSLLISVTPLYDTKFHAGLLYKVYPSAALLVQSFATIRLVVLHTFIIIDLINEMKTQQWKWHNNKDDPPLALK